MPALEALSRTWRRTEMTEIREEMGSATETEARGRSEETKEGRLVTTQGFFVEFSRRIQGL